VLGHNSVGGGGEKGSLFPTLASCPGVIAGDFPPLPVIELPQPTVGEFRSRATIWGHCAAPHQLLRPLILKEVTEATTGHRSTLNAGHRCCPADRPPCFGAKPLQWAPVLADLSGALPMSSWGLCYMGSSRPSPTCHRHARRSRGRARAEQPRSRARYVCAHGPAQLLTAEPFGPWLGCGSVLFQPFLFFWIDLNGIKLVQFIQNFIGKWIQVRKLWKKFVE
jgi:hypothetical protein